MQIVIEISEDIYAEKDKPSFSNKETLEILQSVRNGIALPKGHGDLVDRDDCLAKAWQNFYEHEGEMEKKDKDYILMHRLFEQNGFEVCQQTVVNTSTIIEADKEGEK